MEKHATPVPGRLDARRGQVLIEIPWFDGEVEMVSYFVDEAAARAFSAELLGEERPLSWIGAWSDLDADEVEADLERIRHESKPTPPIELEDL